ncbi:hypothetical protein C2S52_007146 [Perilla frutescens var. hirtella]|nr:hypothetical protein C2S52_007146 [Perilla frutescens var. hirtella]
MLEFLSSYDFDASRGLESKHAIVFSLGGRKFHMSVTNLNIVVRFESDESVLEDAYKFSHCDMPSAFSKTANKIWANLSIDKSYNSSSSKGAHLKDDALRLCHRFLAANVFGRLDMISVVAMQELFLLDCLFSGTKVNFGYWLARQWHFSAKHSLCRAPLGCFVTLLAERLHISLTDPEPLPATLFRLEDYAAMKLLFVNAQGQYQLTRSGIECLSPSASVGNIANSLLPAIETLITTATARLEASLSQ